MSDAPSVVEQLASALADDVVLVRTGLTKL